jgi:hypothetical protein
MIDDEMLELNKGEFLERMKFKVKIPKLLVKLSNTYYAKLSSVAKTFFTFDNK